VAFEPKNLKELLEWRQSLPGGKSWKSQDYLEELGRLCARGLVEPRLGRPVLDGFGLKVGEPQSVPAEAFNDYRLGQEIGTHHGVLLDRSFKPKWVDLRFPNDTHRVWQAALDAGEIRAPRASSPLPEVAQPISAVPTETGAPAPSSTHPPLPEGQSPAPEAAVQPEKPKEPRAAPRRSPPKTQAYADWERDGAIRGFGGWRGMIGA
jgi:hypothetical protein